ncbi:MAG TPA: hypothetical protein VGM86_28380, partial [Thermoanaerobaculia bacterium]
MDTNSRIAFVAVRMGPGPKTTEPQAIVVGTMPAGLPDWQAGDWRYVCYPLRALLALLKDGKDPLVPAPGGEATWAQPADAVQAAQLGSNGRLHKAEREALNAVGMADSFLDKKLTLPASPGPAAEVRRIHTAFPLRSVERIFFYSFEQGSSTRKLETPFAALDTARTVDPVGAASPLAFSAITSAGNDPGSRVVLLQDFSDPKRVGLLAAMAIHLEMKVAANGHRVDDDEPVDPRMLVDAGVIRGSQPLWGIDRMRGAEFDVVKLSCTLGAAPNQRAIGITEKRCDLLKFAVVERLQARITFLPNALQVDDCKNIVDKNNDKGSFNNYLVDRIPAIGALGLPRPVSNFRKAHRVFGFRLFERSLTEPIKMGWRFELKLFEYGGQFAEKTLTDLVPAWTKDDTRKIKSSVKTMFAEEQRLEDVQFKPQSGPSRTSLTVQLLGEGEGDQKDLIQRLTKHVIDASNDAVRQVQTGLKRVRDGRPISLLPELSLPDPLAWHATGFLTDTAPGRRAAGPGSTRTGALVAFEPCLSADVWSMIPKPVSLSVTATLLCLVTEERDAPRYTATLKAPTRQGVTATNSPAFQPLASVDANSARRGTLFSLALEEWPKPPGPPDEKAFARQRRVLIGALELTLAKKFDTGTTGIPSESFGQIALLPLPADTQGHPHPGQLTTAIDAVIVVAVDRVDPGGQDESERDVLVSASQRRNNDLAVAAPDEFAPLLLPLSGPAAESGGTGKTTLKLTAEEAVTRDRDHTLALSLRAVEEQGAAKVAASTQQVLVIDPRPFRIAAVEYQPISAAATSESNEVAVWNAEGEGGLSWRVRDDGQSVGLELPPQVIGEAMEKNRSDRPDLPKDIEPGKPSAVRFGSMTKMRIDPTFADTRFREPGWNLRRILGNALQRLPGARLLDLRLELLYGLLTRIRTEGLFVTELAGAIGEPALPLFDSLDSGQEHLELHKELVNQILEAERFRLAVDKPYRLRPDEFLRIEEGAAFKLRLREVDDAGAPRGGPRTPLRWPVPGGIPADTGGLVKHEVLERTFSTSNRDEDSFPGGLAWAFESANILMSVYGKPQGDGGSVGGIYLSSHGGYGSQRALFDERKSVVETETTQGRVQRYRLERVGRIGCLWHPAKHVIVYERTVVPSGQFYNVQPIGLRQDEHAGRALPRKVEEYVEILKPKRDYPEDGTSVRASGCLLSAEFKSIKIRVDSSWGSDVRREGWQVPLWNTDFEGLKPDPNNPDHPANLFPKPQIRLIFAGRDGNVVKEVDEPAKLVFYTSVVRGEDDRTDLWKPVRDVDFCDAPKISPGQVQTASEDLTDAMLPPEPEHVPGYEKFTIGLVPSKDAVALAHGRVENGPVATLRNVTIARAVALATGPQGQGQPLPEFGRALAAKAANVRAELDRQVGRVLGALEKLDRGTDPDHLKDEARKLIEQAVAGLKLPAVRDELTNLAELGDPCKSLGDRARATIEGQLARLATVAKALLSEASQSIGERIDAAAGVIEADISVVSAMAAQAEELAAQMGRDGLLDEDKRRLLDLARRACDNAVARIKDLHDEAKNRIRARIEAVEKDLKAFPEGLRADLFAIRDRTRANLSVVRDALGSTIESEGKKLRDSLDNLGTAMDDCVKRLQEGVDHATGITKEAQAAAGQMRAKVDEVRAQIRPLIDRLAAAKAPDAAQVLLQNVVIALDKVAALALAVENADLAAPAQAFLDAVKKARDAANAAKEALKKDVNTISGIGLDVLDRIENELNLILDLTLNKADGLIKLLEDATGAIVAKLHEARDNCEEKLKQAADVLTGLVAAVRQEIPPAGTIKIPPELIAALNKLSAEGVGVAGGLRKDLGTAATEIENLRASLLAQIEIATRDLTSIVEAQTGSIGRETTVLIDKIQGVCAKLFAFVERIKSDAQKLIEEKIAKALGVDDLRADLERQLKQTVDKAGQTIAEIKAAVAAEAARVTREAEARVRQIAGTIQQTVQNAVGTDLATLEKRAEGVYQKGDNALRLIRAIGDPPKTDSLGFNRPEVAYVFGEAKELGIDMTPTLALVNRAADQVAAIDQAGKAVGELLDSFGIRLPVGQLADQLIPDKLKNLSVSDLLPDMGGIDLKGLLQRVGFPDLDDSNAVKVRHGFDKPTRRAWMEADLNVPFAESVPLMSFGPVQIVIDTAKFESHARLSAGAGGGIERKMNGRIFGDWRVVSGGQTILTFRQTALTFNDAGQIDFQIQPDRVELAEALRFITDLMRATGQKGGLRIEPLMRGGIPAGVAATLDMVLPPIQTGVFGISDLSLHVMFGIAAIPRFEILSELAVGSRLTPFSLNVWILNGGGYLIQQLTYVPTARPKPLLTYTLDIAIVVGVGVGFSFGVVSGGVYLQVGCGIALTWTTGAGGNTTTMRVFLLARGNVDVAGIVTASIALLFEVSYDGERMIGAGTLTLRI